MWIVPLVIITQQATSLILLFHFPFLKSMILYLSWWYLEIFSSRMLHCVNFQQEYMILSFKDSKL